ncbi:MAG: helix-turn-helix domain-containing protein [Muribaculaceae bacterium]|nr:helix-turn-helix domain-containing protein [Muribaculaceae bacterium]
METIGKTIKLRRRNLEITQQELADLAEVNINTIVSLEKGEGNPKIKTLIQISKVLGLEIDLK